MALVMRQRWQPWVCAINDYDPLIGVGGHVKGYVAGL